VRKFQGFNVCYGDILFIFILLVRITGHFIIYMTVYIVELCNLASVTKICWKENPFE